jgi:hypothetical protein
VAAVAIKLVWAVHPAFMVLAAAVLAVEQPEPLALPVRKGSLSSPIHQP